MLKNITRSNSPIAVDSHTQGKEGSHLDVFITKDLNICVKFLDKMSGLGKTAIGCATRIVDRFSVIVLAISRSFA